MTTSPPLDTRSRLRDRFDGVERAAHWATAALLLLLVATGLALYSSTLMALFGRRRLVELTHLVAGLALPVPVLVAVAGRWGRGLRADLGRLNRWQAADRAWMRWALRHARRPTHLPSGKFNAGQKANAAFTAGAGLVMLGTGAIMHWYHPWPLAWRTGATSTHDWLALLIVVVTAGHTRFALKDPEAMGSMLHGWVTRTWAERHAPLWDDEP